MNKDTSMDKAPKKPTLFVDRDGVICKYVPWLHKIQDFELLPGVISAISKLRFHGFYIIVVTNQAMLAKGLLTFKELDEIHGRMKRELGSASPDAIYFCPHHPEKNPQGVSELQIECECRKPKTGLIEQACKEFAIDLSHSFMVGDSWRDIACGASAGLKTVGILRGEGLLNPGHTELKPNFVCNSLEEAAEWILQSTKV